MKQGHSKLTQSTGPIIDVQAVALELVDTSVSKQSSLKSSLKQAPQPKNVYGVLAVSQRLTDKSSTAAPQPPQGEVNHCPTHHCQPCMPRLPSSISSEAASGAAATFAKPTAASTSE